MLYCKDAPESGNAALLPRQSPGTERLMAKNGEWRMENGEWRMESGEWRVENEEWRVKCNRKDVPKMEHCLCDEV